MPCNWLIHLFWQLNQSVVRAGSLVFCSCRRSVVGASLPACSLLQTEAVSSSPVSVCRSVVDVELSHLTNVSVSDSATPPLLHSHSHSIKLFFLRQRSIKPEGPDEFIWGVNGVELSPRFPQTLKHRHGFVGLRASPAFLTFKDLV